MKHAQPSNTRRRGRPTSGTDQREILLDAAISLFGERGIAATTQNAIARKAGVTPALLNYYFRGRPPLLEAVVEERLMPLVGPIVEGINQIDDDADPRQVLPRMIAGILGSVATAPWLPQLWVREILSEGGQLRQVLLTRVVPHAAAKVRTLVERGQARKTINPDLDPRLLVVSMIGLSIFMLAAEPIWRQLPDSTDIDHDTLSRHVLALLRSGLEPPHEMSN